MTSKTGHADQSGSKRNRSRPIKASELLSNMTDLELQYLLKKLSGSKNTAKQANIIRAVIKKRRGMNDYAIARELEMAYSTLRGWLVRIAERDLDGLYDIHISNNKYVLNDACMQTDP